MTDLAGKARNLSFTLDFALCVFIFNLIAQGNHTPVMSLKWMLQLGCR
jgi:hypothetical protein